tara:strand:+ start:243959 stop:245233 length:1275 start_codon:yes stop_codon:yes gene_type:complete
MTKRRHSISVRIAGAFFLLAFIFCTFFTVVSNFSLNVVERQLVNNRLKKVTTQLIDQYQQHLLTSTIEDNFYVNEEIPAEYRNLREGIHEVHGQGREVTVSIRNIGNDHFAVADDTSDFAATEKITRIALGVGFVASLLLAILLGWIASRRIVAPVTALAAAIERDDPSSSLPSLQSNDEIGMLARAYAKRTNQLHGFLADEKLFTGDVSHELRTPLTIILGASELLTVRLQNMQEEQDVAERIRRIATEASERVGALLLLSQSPTALIGAPMSLTHLIEREIERCQIMLLDKPVNITFDSGSEEVWVHARAELVGIAIGNLIRNACQYTERGVIKISLHQTQLSIEDQGPGLPENVRHRLFQRFVRGQDHQHVGSGLGLAIVKRVIDHLGWQIRHETIVVGGSRFIIDFDKLAIDDEEQSQHS